MSSGVLPGGTQTKRLKSTRRHPLAGRSRTKRVGPKPTHQEPHGPLKRSMTTIANHQIVANAMFVQQAPGPEGENDHKGAGSMRYHGHTCPLAWIRWVGLQSSVLMPSLSQTVQITHEYPERNPRGTPNNGPKTSAKDPFPAAKLCR